MWNWKNRTELNGGDGNQRPGDPVLNSRMENKRKTYDPEEGGGVKYDIVYIHDHVLFSANSE